MHGRLQKLLSWEPKGLFQFCFVGNLMLLRKRMNIVKNLLIPFLLLWEVRFFFSSLFSLLIYLIGLYVTLCHTSIFNYKLTYLSSKLVIWFCIKHCIIYINLFSLKIEFGSKSLFLFLFLLLFITHIMNLTWKFIDKIQIDVCMHNAINSMCICVYWKNKNIHTLNIG